MPDDKIGASIFISFAEEDLKFVEDLVERLRQLHFEPWYYTRSMTPGTLIHQALMQAIGTASAVIVVVSNHSGQSPYVLREVHYAENKRKRIIPLQLDDANTPWTFLLGNIRYIDARHGRDYMPELQNALNGLPLPTTPTPPSPWRRRMLFVSKIGVVALVVLSLIGMGWNHPLRNVPEAIWMLRPFYDQPPSVPSPINQSLGYYGDRDNNETGKRFDAELSTRFRIDTGIRVDVFNPKEEERLEGLKEVFAQQSDEYDVVMIDIVWVGELAEHLIDLRPYFSEEEIKQHSEAIIDNNTIEGNLVAMPWFEDLGLLYYREDLLKNYGYNSVPDTWEELEEVAAKIQAGERANNPDFIGFAWQGAVYEGLTCNALEWIASWGGFDPTTGQILIDDEEVFEAVVEALDHVRVWVQGPNRISLGVLNDKEEESLARFSNGNAAFLRMWPNAYAKLKQTEVSFGVAPLPRANGHQSVGVVGGWQLAVPK